MLRPLSKISFCTEEIHLMLRRAVKLENDDESEFKIDETDGYLDENDDHNDSAGQIRRLWQPIKAFLLAPLAGQCRHLEDHHDHLWRHDSHYDLLLNIENCQPVLRILLSGQWCHDRLEDHDESLMNHWWSSQSTMATITMIMIIAIVPITSIAISIIIIIAIMMGVKGVEQLPLIASIGLSHHALQQKAFVGRGWVVMMVKRGW